MPTTQLDRELAAYLRGRREELNDVYVALEKVRRLGFINVDTANAIIDQLAVVDRRPTEIVEDGE